jgi:uncharacterized protein YrrD
MLLLQKNLENIPIMSLQNGRKLGLAQNPIIDPRKLQIVAYHANGPHIHKASVLHTADIREYGPLGFIVDSADSIMELDEDLIRLNEIIGFNFSLLGKQVVDENKSKLGKVIDYAVDIESFFIQKIHVAQSLVKNLTSSNLIIGRTQIVELNDKFIVVRSGSVHDQAGLMQALNPFRKAQSPLAPEPNTSQPL